jgi:hypothetical protein
MVKQTISRQELYNDMCDAENKLDLLLMLFTGNDIKLTDDSLVITYKGIKGMLQMNEMDNFIDILTTIVHNIPKEKKKEE